MVPVPNFNGPEGYKAQANGYNQYIQPGFPVKTMESPQGELIQNIPISGYQPVPFQPQTQYPYHNPYSYGNTGYENAQLENTPGIGQPQPSMMGQNMHPTMGQYNAYGIQENNQI